MPFANVKSDCGITCQLEEVFASGKNVNSKYEFEVHTHLAAILCSEFVDQITDSIGVPSASLVGFGELLLSFQIEIRPETGEGPSQLLDGGPLTTTSILGAMDSIVECGDPVQ